ncbi:hypothetical protein QTH97_34150 [Variovorax sp. J22R24]|uniref:hypothetical protein n=1 Tax=Variovorax gracilis TaxID=3053502 RepID=UPI002574DE14|nr:hypothetical protein [Variovorax sp. J22R24]MDM0109994.1 hypothetical protein [Variovorax sp. J22R24]
MGLFVVSLVVLVGSLSWKGEVAQEARLEGREHQYSGRLKDIACMEMLRAALVGVEPAWTEDCPDPRLKAPQQTVSQEVARIMEQRAKMERMRESEKPSRVSPVDLAVFTTALSFFGFMFTTIVGWRKERRDASHDTLDTEKKELEIAKLRSDLDALAEKKNGEPRRVRRP